ncbi:MAG: prepilin peptidase [Nocardioidaceae bacterium]
MPWSLLVAVMSAAVCGVASAYGPKVIARLPEPQERRPSSQPELDGLALPAAADGDRGVLEPIDKTPYADLARRPHLTSKLGITGGVVGALIGWRLGWAAPLPAWVFLGWLGVILGYVDAQTRLLPTRLIAPGYAVVIALLLLAAGLDGGTHQLAGAVLGWAVMGGFYFLMWFIYPKGLGYGDVRLSGLIGLALGYLGWGALVTGLYSGFLLGGVGGGLLMLLRIVNRKHFPFGPFMLLGALVGLIWGSSFAQWYGGG